MRAEFPVLLLFAALAASAATFPSASPSTTNNDDSCDIALQPAATLLLPYFEVGLGAGPRRTTLVSITNVTQEPQIARVTLWTDLAYPVLTFNVFLTGYDVHSLDLYDVIARGMIAESSSTGTYGPRSLDNAANQRFLPGAAAACASLPGRIPETLRHDVQTALTAGTYSTCGSTRIGLTHINAIGYATIDVVATCSAAGPTERSYFAEELLFDNVLMGEAVAVDGDSFSTYRMVHVRAVPEGGFAGISQPTNLAYTFYDRLTGAVTPALTRTTDRRQPLPSAFAARFVQDLPRSTTFAIWREAVTGMIGSACRDYVFNGAVGTASAVFDIIRFDEHENPTTLASGIVIPTFPSVTVVLPATSSTPTSAGIFPPMSAIAGDGAGWLYLNLTNRGSEAYSASREFRTSGSIVTHGVRQSQNWMSITMRSDGRFAGTMDAIALANGCSPSALKTSPGLPIAPGPNITP